MWNRDIPGDQNTWLHTPSRCRLRVTGSIEKVQPTLSTQVFWGGVYPMETQDRGTGMLPWAAEKHSTNMYSTRCPWIPLVHKSKAEGVGREQEIGAI